MQPPKGGATGRELPSNHCKKGNQANHYRVLKKGSQPGVSTGEFGESVNLDGEKQKTHLCFHQPQKKGSSSRCEWRPQITTGPGVPVTLSPAEITVMERMTVPEKTLKQHSR